MTAALEWSEWSAARSGRTLPSGKTRYPFYRRLGGPQGRSGRAENLVPTGIRSRTVQSVVSLFTDWATWPTYYIIYIYILRDLSICLSVYIYLSVYLSIYLSVFLSVCLYLSIYIYPAILYIKSPLSYALKMVSWKPKHVTAVFL